MFYRKQPIYNPQMTKGAPYVSGDGCTGETLKGYAKKIITTNPGLRFPRTVQKFVRETGLHPTQKPLALEEYLIRTYTNENDWVLDNTMGSGTTGVACVRLGRNFIGIESDAKHFQLAKGRIEQEMQDKLDTFVPLRADDIAVILIRKDGLMSYATDKKAKFMKDQKNPLRLLARVFRDTPMMRLRSIYAHAVEMFPRLSVYITTRPENTPEWQLKIEAIQELFSDPGFRLRFAMVEGAQLFDTIEESKTFRYPESANESSHTRRVYLEMRLRSPFILSDDDPGENRNGRYYPKTYAGMVEADNHFAGGASQYLKLTPRSFFVIWQTLFYLGTLRCASYVGLNASNDSTKPASGWRACGRNHNRSHSDYSVRPVSFNAPITGIQGIISGVRDSTKCKKAARLGVFQEHSSASAEAVRQAISKGRRRHYYFAEHKIAICR